MKEETLKESFLLKSISYILLPIFVILIITNSIILAFGAQYPEAREEKKDYYSTEIFATIYENKLNPITGGIKNITNNKYYNAYTSNYESSELILEGEKTTNSESSENPDLILEEEKTTVQENKNEKDREKIYYTARYQATGIRYLIINKNTNEYFTNLDRTSRTDSVEKIKQNILSRDKYWNIENKKINTNIEKLSENNIIQGTTYQDIMNMGYDIYTSYSEGNTEISLNDDIATTKFLYEISVKYYDMANILLAISIIGAFVTFVYLIISAGHKKGKEGICLEWIDELPLEILGLFIFITASVGGLLIYGSVALMEYVFNTGLMLMNLSTYLMGITLIYLGLSIIKRIKARQLIRNTIIWRIFRFIKRIWVKAVNNITANTKLSTRITIACLGFLAISFILILLKGVGTVFLLGFWIYVYLWIIEKVNETMKIHKALKNIYEGNTNIELNENELRGVLKEMAIYVKDIAGGFSNAVEESIKSERMKTELITNVSHDIKTPLTSIINYVDLLKTEDLQDEKAREYLEILDNKSQRLKKLIEDLVEASKASSGNIKLEKQLININELIKQVGGEFEDKFKEKGLEVIADYLKEDAYILADNRYIYRIIENIYSNVSKYALENSRVYIDIKKIDNKINIAVKNISKERLNISTEELMQRFVRGDSSRNTEGSGLGLSIASSLTELQGGTFNIYLDGDLFKVVIEFESQKNDKTLGNK